MLGEKKTSKKKSKKVNKPILVIIGFNCCH
ncbi:hypothetical protein MOC76_07735 [Bacillus spizizenii]|nr:hypothetical protein [Bacillus spizizenii]MCY8063155.1 hypothetical protein [Bacillus spizizenii]MCY8133695.1 hypothetical protein [Bacillus spizizenii]MCY8156491.1 hypothetical protein [Bacillus spizizenii]MCY8257459.1 hypothetical protein [Bacillus spizizenii]